MSAMLDKFRAFRKDENLSFLYDIIIYKTSGNMSRYKIWKFLINFSLTKQIIPRKKVFSNFTKH